MFEKLEEVFDLVPSPDGTFKIEDGDAVGPVGNQPQPSFSAGEVTVSDDPEVELRKDREDRELVRNTYKFILERTSMLYETAKDVADESGSPRSIEVAGNLLKNMADIAGKLEDLANSNIQKKRAGEQKPSSPSGGDTTINNNNLYVGSSEDLMKLIRGGQV